MTETNKEKLTPTYKKYAKNLGQLFWELENTYNPESGEYIKSWGLIMVTGLGRRYGRGRYVYNVSALGADSPDWKSDYRYDSANFVNNLLRNRIRPLDKSNPNPPPLQQK